MTDFNTMYSDDEGNTPIKNRAPVPSTLGTHSVADVNSHYITVNGEKFEVVKKSYVEKIEKDLSKTQRELRTAQSRISQLTRVLTSLSGDIKELRIKLNTRGRFD